MKAAIVEKIGTFTIVDIPVPEPGDGEVLIETAVSGLCRTDLKIIEVGHRDLLLPRVPGEEVVGTICAVGRGVASEYIGQRVYVYPGTSCGMCKACLQGAENLCHEMKIMGFHRDGGFAEYVIAPVKSTIRIPDGCAFDHAVTAEPLSCCLNALELAALRPTEKIDAVTCSAVTMPARSCASAVEAPRWGVTTTSGRAKIGWSVIGS